MTGAPRHAGLWQGLGLALLAFLTLGFVVHAAVLGWSGLSQDRTGLSRFYSAQAPANIAIFGHMVAGAVITLLAPVQAIPALRRRWPGLHRRLGRLLVACAVATALGGLVYIALRGTIGGASMSIAFAVYGLLMALCALQALRHARARRFARHSDWALRLFVLAIGSWLYRVHYGLWELATGGAASNAAFTGAFDKANLWAFYLPYLAMLEWALWARGRGLFAKGPAA